MFHRFPVPDLRASQGIDKPWWRRCLQKEVLILKFSDVDVHTCVNASSPVSKVEVTCKEVHGMLPMLEDTEMISSLKLLICVYLVIAQRFGVELCMKLLINLCAYSVIAQRFDV